MDEWESKELDVLDIKKNIKSAISRKREPNPLYWQDAFCVEHGQEYFLHAFYMPTHTASLSDVSMINVLKISTFSWILSRAQCELHASTVLKIPCDASFGEFVLRTLKAAYPKCNSCEELGVSVASVVNQCDQQTFTNTITTHIITEISNWNA